MSVGSGEEDERVCAECGHEAPTKFGLVREVDGTEQWYCLVHGDLIDEREGRRDR